MTRSFMLEQLSAEYVTTARVKGMSERQVIWGHAFKNIRVQLITVIALSYAGLLEGSVLTEIIFSWPGIGLTIYQAIQLRDYPVIQAGILFLGFKVVLINLLVDILYRYLNPRVGLN